MSQTYLKWHEFDVNVVCTYLLQPVLINVLVSMVWVWCQRCMHAYLLECCVFDLLTSLYFFGMSLNGMCLMSTLYACSLQPGTYKTTL